MQTTIELAPVTAELPERETGRMAYYGGVSLDTSMTEEQADGWFDALLEDMRRVLGDNHNG